MQVHAKVFFFYQLVATIPGFMQTDYSEMAPLGFSELGVFFSNLSRDSTLASTKIGHCAKTDSGRTTLVPASLVPAVFFHNLSGQGELQDPWSGVVRRDSKWRGAPMPCRGRPPRIQKLAGGRDGSRLQSFFWCPGSCEERLSGFSNRPGSASPCKAEGSAFAPRGEIPCSFCSCKPKVNADWNRLRSPCRQPQAHSVKRGCRFGVGKPARLAP